MFAQAYTLFGILALLLASIGLFGVMSYNVARRTNEIGIRMALGAQPTDVLGMVMRESMLLVVVGVVLGLVTAVIASRFVTTLLFGLPPTDPTTIVLAVLVMSTVSALAGYLPARRASRVDPMVALPYEQRALSGPSSIAPGPQFVTGTRGSNMDRWRSPCGTNRLAKRRTGSDET